MHNDDTKTSYFLLQCNMQTENNRCMKAFITPYLIFVSLIWLNDLIHCNSFSIPYLWMIMISENKIKSVTMKYFCKYKFLKCKPDCYYFCWASIPMKVSWETELYFNRHESKFMRPIIIINTSANFGDAVFILLRIFIFCFQSGIA